ncbi:MAG: cyclic pyranopterin monophosphate synthase MoaC [Chloroflexota bacterium]|nr:MAG: cyclic pyranopterin monophosphate synthase MoaC [Chloroflexota bacterium]
MRDDSFGSRLTHVDEDGEARMVDVTDKDVTVREARARAAVHMSSETLELLRTVSARKGDALAVARIAGILAAKRTSTLIPLCHGLPLSTVRVELELDAATQTVLIEAYCRTEAKTGVEMEALMAVSVAALTVYDMCKAVDRAMTIDDIHVTYKSGGRSGIFENER